MVASIVITVGAENVRHLKARSSGRYTHGSGLDLHTVEPLQGTLRPLDTLEADVRVHARGPYRSVTEQGLNDYQIRAGVQKMRGEAMPQGLSTMLIHRRCESVTGIMRSSTTKVTSCGVFADTPKTATSSS